MIRLKCRPRWAETRIGELTIAQSEVDRCVAGSLRKGAKRLLSSFVRCGASARLRLDKFDLVPHCAERWSIQVLYRELSRLLVALGHEPGSETIKRYAFDDLPTLAACAIPDEAWTKLAVGAEPTARAMHQPRVSGAMAGDLTALRDAVAERLGGSQ